MQKKSKKIIIFSLFIFTAAIILTGCTKKTAVKKTTVAVFVPGIAADSPTYSKLVKGVTLAVEEFNNTKTEDEKVDVTVLEAGTNQAEWSNKLTSLASTGKYDVIISSNPSLPELCVPLTEQFPKQKFILLDSELDGNTNISCLSYNQKDEAYLTGYIAGLMSTSKKIGLIAAQEYPVMNNVLLPYYTKGAQDADSSVTIDFRIVGNWYDGTKGAELANAMYVAGVDVILPICGGASQGVIASAKENNFYLTWFDENGFDKAPGKIISSCYAKQDTVAKEMTLEFLNGNTEWGKTKYAGFTDGYFEFVEDDPNYINTVPEEIRNKMHILVKGITEGTIVIE